MNHKHTTPNPSHSGAGLRRIHFTPFGLLHATTTIAIAVTTATCKLTLVVTAIVVLCDVVRELLKSYGPVFVHVHGTEDALELRVRRILLSHMIGEAHDLAKLPQERRVTALRRATNGLNDLDPRDDAVLVPVKGLEKLVPRRLEDTVLMDRRRRLLAFCRRAAYERSGAVVRRYFRCGVVLDVILGAYLGRGLN